MMTVELLVDDVTYPVARLVLDTAVGEPSRARIRVFLQTPQDPRTWLDKPAAVRFRGPHGERAVHGFLTQISAVATADPNTAREYEVLLASQCQMLELRHRSRVFRRKTAPQIIEEVLGDIGIAGDHFGKELLDEHAELPHTVQYDETDAAFVRRLCEREGLWFRHDEREGFDRFVLCDSSTTTDETPGGPVQLVEAHALGAEKRIAWSASARRKRRPGRVIVRDYNVENPRVELAGKHEDGLDAEKSIEVYAAPAGFLDEAEGDRRARLLAESLRADASTIELETSALDLTAGRCFEIQSDIAAGTGVFEGEYFATRTHLEWTAGEASFSARVWAIPRARVYRLPHITPRPRIHGVQPAFVTTAPGEEISTDELGRVHVRFLWDRAAPNDHTASLPIRVMQPNMPGSMLVPRVGWEVQVAFEDGDPERPYVLGRVYNGRNLPPFPLPANKTVTTIGTASSPGGGQTNMVRFDDAAGRQHLVWTAGFGMTTTVANNMLQQTVGFESVHVKGNQTFDIGGNQTISVQNAALVGAASQSLTVGGNQTITLKATGSTTVASESVAIGGALIELVGNPKDGLASFAESAVLAGVGSIPVVGAAMTRGYNIGKALGQGYARGGMDGLLDAAGQTAINEIAGAIPGGDAIVAAADPAGLTPWSQRAQDRSGAEAAGGGSGGSGGSGADGAAAAAGHRNLLVNGIMTESIGALLGMQTPSMINWTTLGASTFAIGGSHSTSAVRISRLTAGASSDTSATLAVTAAQAIGRNVTGAHTRSVAGAYTANAGAGLLLQAKGSMSIQVGGPATLEGGKVVFEVPGASVSVQGGGVTLKAASITINGKTVKSGKESVG